MKIPLHFKVGIAFRCPTCTECVTCHFTHHMRDQSCQQGGNHARQQRAFPDLPSFLHSLIEPHSGNERRAGYIKEPFPHRPIVLSRAHPAEELRDEPMTTK